jgi:hypothetical protein
MIIQNGFATKDKIYISTHRHDYVSVEIDDVLYFTDGGHDYIRCNISKGDQDVSIISLDDSSTINEVINLLCWGGRGKDGKSPLTYRFIKDLELDYLESLMEYSKTHTIEALRLFVMQYWLHKKKLEE